MYPGEVLSFCSLGPKSYIISYRQNNEIKSVTKLKGISLSSKFLDNQINLPLFENYLTTFLSGEVQKIEIAQLRTRRKVGKSLKIEQNLVII